MEFKSARQETHRYCVNPSQLGDWLANYVAYYEVVDPNGLYTLEYVNIFPNGESGYIQELKIKRVDRATRPTVTVSA